MSSSNRFHFLDSLRGFAVAGILLVNAADLMCLGHDVPVRPFQAVPLAENVLNFLVATRFVPIFSFMFGMSMGFVIDSAIRRGAPAWKILLRRLAALLVIGLLHSILYPGEILRDYAVAGVILLPFILKVPRSVRLVLGLLATIGAYAFTGGGALSLPGPTAFRHGSSTPTVGSERRRSYSQPPVRPRSPGRSPRAVIPDSSRREESPEDSWPVSMSAFWRCSGAPRRGGP